MPAFIPMTERLAKHSVPEPNSGCVLWLGAVNNHGYGVLGRTGRNRFAHRVAWRLANGPIPDGSHVCHKCDVPSCIKPSHLFIGSAKHNIADCVAKGRHFWAAKTHCPHGHEYTPENTVVRKRASGTFRRCLACLRGAWARRSAAISAARAASRAKLIAEG